MQTVKRTFEAPTIGFLNIEGQKFPYTKRKGFYKNIKGQPKRDLSTQNSATAYELGKTRETLVLEDLIGDLWYSEKLDLFFFEKEKLESYNFVFLGGWLTWTSLDGLRVYKTQESNFCAIIEGKIQEK